MTQTDVLCRLLFLLVLYYDIEIPLSDANPYKLSRPDANILLITWLNEQLPQNRGVRDFSSDWTDGTRIAALLCQLTGGGTCIFPWGRISTTNIEKCGYARRGWHSLFEAGSIFLTHIFYHNSIYLTTFLTIIKLMMQHAPKRILFNYDINIFLWNAAAWDQWVREWVITCDPAIISWTRPERILFNQLIKT